ncbi:unnamed protein product [Spirodela intermedia]|uniref:Uncharacterized protein n=2 Tax=Spirodela intermedia TaxID=51605 RepID=A0A7I8JE05_SPIIN|nr:unnamed protein product [Spirodela intermedia]CAA6668241.1 unnamed protein product [Spirodela intermedia]CAA7405073.1 unnamed protein product [Spirodela intermedia]
MIRGQIARKEFQSLNNCLQQRADILTKPLGRVKSAVFRTLTGVQAVVDQTRA